MKRSILLISCFAILSTGIFIGPNVQAETLTGGPHILLAAAEAVVPVLTEAQIAEAAAAAAAQTGGTILGVTVTAGTVTTITVVGAVVYTTVANIIDGTSTTTHHTQ